MYHEHSYPQREEIRRILARVRAELATAEHDRAHDPYRNRPVMRLNEIFQRACGCDGQDRGI